MRRRRLAVVLGVLGITAGGAGAARMIFDRLVYDAEPAVSRAVPEATRTLPTVQVLTVHGAVERASGSGAWGPVAAGDQLGPEDSIRTGPSSAAELGIGERSRMTVTAASHITVREVTSAVQRFRLARGRIAVDYGEGRERRLRVEDEAGRTVEAEQARFGVLATGAVLAVATEAGSVTLHARGAAVAVGAGQQASARGDAPPSPAEPIPSALLLKLASAAAGSEECAALSGRVSPASAIHVDGKAVAVGDDGRFAVRVRRRRDRATVLVTVTDALGRTAERVLPCLDREPEVKKLSVRWKN